MVVPSGSAPHPRSGSEGVGEPADGSEALRRDGRVGGGSPSHVRPPPLVKET